MESALSEIGGDRQVSIMGGEWRLGAFWKRPGTEAGEEGFLWREKDAS